MKGTERLLAFAVAATLAAAVVAVFVKDTEPDMPFAEPPATPTPTATETETVDPSPTALETPTLEPTTSADPEPVTSPTVRPRTQSPPEREPLPDTGVPSQSILGVFALLGAGVLALERRWSR